MAKRVTDWFVYGVCDKEEMAYVVQAATMSGAFERVAELTGKHIVRHEGKVYLANDQEADIQDELDGNMGSPRRSPQATATPLEKNVNLLG